MSNRQPLQWSDARDWLSTHGVPDEPLQRPRHVELVASEGQAVVVIEFIPDPPRVTRRGDAMTETRYYPLEQP